MNKLVFTLFLFLTACGSSNSTEVNLGLPFHANKYPVHPDTSPELVPIVKKFAYESERMGNKVSVETMPVIISTGLRSTLLGVCKHGVSVEINKNQMWDIPSTEMVVFHELGHCLLGKEHEDSEVPTTSNKNGEIVINKNSTLPATLMSIRGVSDSAYKKNYISYLKELFLNQKPYFLKYQYDFKQQDEWDKNFYKENFPEYKI